MDEGKSPRELSQEGSKVEGPEKGSEAMHALERKAETKAEENTAEDNTKEDDQS